MKPHMLQLRSTLICTFAILAFIAASAHAQVVIEQNTVIGDRDTSLHGQHVIVRGATLTINGVHPLASLTVERNASNQPGIVTHSPGFEYKDGSGFWLIVDGDVFVEGGDEKLDLVASRIDVLGRGYGAGQGPGAGQGSGSTGSGAGGGHGGAGSPGTHSSSIGGGTYGSFAFPDTMGSGGSNSGGAGGGVIRLSVDGTLTVDGMISAAGHSISSHSSYGGGAGGSIWIDCGMLTGSGVIAANGGVNSAAACCGSAGGGRVAVYADASSFDDVNIRAWGGGDVRPGGAGTVYYRPAINDPATLIIDNGGQPFVNATTEINEPVIVPGNLFVRNEGNIGGPRGSTTWHLIVEGDAVIAHDGAFNMNGRGYATGEGPGAGQGSGSIGSGAGGGHGGAGSPGTHSSSIGGGTYGSFAYPTAMGSGGGPSSGSGSGGGVIRLTVNGTLTVHGVVTADGTGATTNSQSGGGAGGSIWIRSGIVTGAGVISASGGSSNNSSAGSGGGGRIAVYSCNTQLSTSQVLVNSNVPRPGQPGTIFYFADSIDLLEHPQSQDVLQGDTVSFSVVADGDEELTYQWRYNGVFIEDDAHFSGSHTPTLTIMNVTCLDHLGEYEAVVTDACGFVFSQPATLIVRKTGDLNFDCIVDADDLSIMLGAWGECDDMQPCEADINGDGQVDADDLGILLGAWGQ